MNADEAFARLMRDGKLEIPVARAVPSPASVTAGGGFSGSPRPIVVDEFFESGEPDYKPGDVQAAVDPVASGRPTETGLKPVEDAETEAEENPVGIEDSDASPEKGRNGDSDANLGRAHRVKRFNCLPLAVGAAGFEVQAMDLAARLSSLNPAQPSLLVTSSRRGEGRTELALRLALALARRIGARILLVDFDLKRPQASARLGISAKYFTLADVLRGACPIGEALTVSDEDGLYLLPARASDRMGDEFVDVRGIGAFMRTIHQTFDFIVFDCPPADHTDTLNLCRHAGAALLCGFSGVTSAWGANAAADRLAAAGARVAGMILLGE